MNVLKFNCTFHKHQEFVCVLNRLKQRGIESNAGLFKDSVILRQLAKLHNDPSSVKDVTKNLKSGEETSAENNHIKDIKPRTESLKYKDLPPSYWTQFGPAVSRESRSSMMAKTTIHRIIQNLPGKSSIAFTDGSCITEPGPFGSGAFIIPSNGLKPVQLKQSVSWAGSILLSELNAIKLVLDYFLSSEKNRKDTESINIFSDSQIAISSVLSLRCPHTVSEDENEISKTEKNAVKDIQLQMQSLKQEGFNTCLIWTPAHADILGNEIANTLARNALQLALDNKREHVKTITENRNISKEQVEKWQKSNLKKLGL